MKKLFTVISIKLLVLTSVFFLASDTKALVNNNQPELVVLASDPADEAQCPDNFLVAISAPIQEFYRTADEVLLTANLSSQSLNYLFRNYRNTQNNIRQTQETFRALTTRVSDNPEDIIEKCTVIANQSRQDLRYVFLTVYTQVTHRKKDFLLFEKYDAVNSKFEVLQDDLNDITSGLQKFNDLFPCFVTSCISR